MIKRLRGVKPSPLTPAEKRVCTFVLNGVSNRWVAYALGVTEGTVKNHLRSAFLKLGIKRQADIPEIK